MIVVPEWLCYLIGGLICIVLSVFTYCSLLISSRCSRYEEYQEVKDED